jgi:hypothetical protein
MKSLKNQIFQGLLISSALLLSAGAYAKTVNLYEQPNDTAKVAGTIDLSAGLVPIFSSKDGLWMKVGDPKNGNVGWVKSSEMSGENGSSVSFTQRIYNNGKGPQTVQFIQYGPAKQRLTDEQAQNMLNRMEEQQLRMQREAEHMFREMNMGWGFSSPVFMPVVYVPVPVKQLKGQQNVKGAAPTVNKPVNAPNTQSTPPTHVPAITTPSTAIKTAP